MDLSAKKKKAKMSFWSLHFGVIVNLVPHFDNDQFGPYYFQLVVNLQSISVSELTERTKLTTS